jgi:hypothetical protein
MGTTKTWVDVDDFATAYYVACAMHGVKLTKKEMAMLKDHHAKGKRAEFKRQFYPIARKELGLGPGLDFLELGQLCKRADELADQARNEGEFEK